MSLPSHSPRPRRTFQPRQVSRPRRASRFRRVVLPALALLVPLLPAAAQVPAVGLPGRAPTATSTAAPTAAPSSAPGTAPAAGPEAAASGQFTPSGKLVFDESFTNPPLIGTRWHNSSTSAYRYGTHNPDDDKLDWLQPNALSTVAGKNVFTAAPGLARLENGKQSWDTGLLTTEYTQQGFQVRPGDYAEVRLQLPSGYGAWPALWTWKDGGNEIDSFEYHPDNPNLLELSNRIHSAGLYYSDPNAVRPGAWISIGVRYGATNNEWYVNRKLVFSDHTGTGPNWSAYLILNLSICAGYWHPAPVGSASVTTAADYLRVWRPSTSTSPGPTTSASAGPSTGAPVGPTAGSRG
ncbi:beta-glucanase [Kitasatospora sp. NPDC088134]|uniref:glycoside hydrolase family 16 protein n=1 Tax=Kitasatospora sp. NPDC088134 TaxID=3364071 RepID=UPI00380CDEEA